MNRLWFLTGLVLITGFCNAQSKRASRWYFGHMAGLDFSSGTVKANVDGQLASIEGCASMCDESGNLLFYSSGETVWNMDHQPMPNGNITGDQSSTQSSLAVPLPGSNTKYYLFSSVGNMETSGLYYNVIDMTLDGGRGDVSASRNVKLMGDGSEQLGATMHCNATDYWIVGRQRKEGALRFLAWLLTSDGLSEPVISEFTVPTPVFNAVGTMTFSTDGGKMALSTFETGTHLFSFDIESGTLALAAQIPGRTNEMAYSNAFSPNATKLYTTSIVPGGFNYLSQYDLNAADISASRADLDRENFEFGSPNGFPFIGQIRLAPDQKIYVSRWNQSHPYDINPSTFYSLDSLDVIHSPDLRGAACQHQRNFYTSTTVPQCWAYPIL